VRPTTPASLASAIAGLALLALASSFVLPRLVPPAVVVIAPEWSALFASILVHAVGARVVLAAWHRGRARRTAACAVACAVASVVLWGVVQWGGMGGLMPARLVAAAAACTFLALGFGLASLALVPRPPVGGSAGGRVPAALVRAARHAAAALGFLVGAVLAGGLAAFVVLEDAASSSADAVLDGTLRAAGVLALLHAPLSMAVWIVDRARQGVDPRNAGDFRCRVACPRCGRSATMSAGEDHCPNCGLVVRMARP